MHQRSAPPGEQAELHDSFLSYRNTGQSIADASTGTELLPRGFEWVLDFFANRDNCLKSMVFPVFSQA